MIDHFKFSSFYFAIVFLFLIVIKGSFCITLSAESKRSARSLSSSKFCPANSYCMPISSCPILKDIIKNDCVINNRISSLSCGYQGSGLVCCPQGNDPTSVNHDKFVDGQVCGQSAVQGQNYQGIGAHPWVARIGFKSTGNGETKYPCAGSIINRRIVLTAAHCALAKANNYKLNSVRIGEWDSNNDIDCGAEFCGLPVQDIGISHVIVHPDYQKQSFKNNIALIVLRAPINYTVTAQPICLPESWSVTSDNGQLVGWGKAAGQTHTPSVQQTISLPIVHIRSCYTVYGQSLPITENHLCAGGEQGNDACSGFGGAPLVVQHSGYYYQVGILSFGSDQCGARGVPSVYTNIKKYVTWIKENIPNVYTNL